MKSIVSPVWAAMGAVLLTAACASNDKQVAAVDPATAGKVCSVYYKTGSNMPTRECHEPVDEAERELMLKQVRDAMRVRP